MQDIETLAYCGEPLINLDEIKKYWEASLPERLQDDETVRVVTAVIEEDGTYGQYGVSTPKTQIRDINELIAVYSDLQKRNPNKSVGISVSTAVFNYTGETPKIDAFKYSNTIAVDIDTHIGDTKERYILGGLSQDQISLAALTTYIEISRKFQEFGIGVVKPKYASSTGGGLLFIFEFEKQLTKQDAQKIYGLLKKAIGDLKWNTSLKGGIMGTYDKVSMDIDKTFADLAHVQRCSGSINQKYNIRAKSLDLFDLDNEALFNLSLRLRAEVETSGYSNTQKEEFKMAIEKLFKQFNDIIGLSKPVVNVTDNIITAKMQSARAFIKPSDLRNVENDLLRKLKEANIDVLELVRGEVNFGPTSGNLTKLFCPFHEESNPSMAFYRNELFDVFKDFHDNTTYSFITFWEKLYKVTKSDAISQISEKAGVNLSKGERKEFQNLELTEIIDELLKRIDTENFVYYRLASKNRTCIARNIDTGEPYVFDGPKMLATHILTNQLGVCDAEQALVHEFAIRFQERVLIDAFEEFSPGKPTVFSKDFIKFVNLWVPSDKYKRVHIRAEEIKEQAKDLFTIEEAIELIKRKTPWSYKFLLQIVQNGDLEWFVNWLSATSKFQTVPTVPVVFGVQGAGKNLFVNTIMDFYLNNEYVKIVSGDRIMQQFNSILESTSLLVLDEGDFSNGKEIDQLKLLTGNDKILIEKKGVDASNKTRHFNIMFFSNGEVPVRHPAMDRRITYFNHEVPLLASCDVWKTSIDDMVVQVQSEMVEFWAIIVNTMLDHKMAMQNSKNGQFWKQILLQHPFGGLVVKLMNGDWKDIALQLNENVQDKTEMGINLTLLENIKDQFESDGKISLTLINRFIHSLNYRMKQSIQKFIQMNYLQEFGINTVIEDDEVKIQVDKKKVQISLKVKNVLKVAYPKTFKQEVSELAAELAMEQADAGVEAEQVKEANNTSGVTPPPPPNFGA